VSGGCEGFIESLGRHFEEENKPRIAGRLLAVLMLNPDPLSLDDLADRLQVSKASISSNARLLELAGVAERVTVPGDRRDYYRIGKNAQVRVLEHQVERIRILHDRLRLGYESVPAEELGVRCRFEGSLEHIERGMAAMVAELERLRSRLDARAAAGGE
jgi:DNA-binding transcriptional regulator GbsR (MarR family)